MASAHTTASALRYAKSQRGWRSCARTPTPATRSRARPPYARAKPSDSTPSEYSPGPRRQTFAFRPSRLLPADMRTQDVRPPSPGVVALRGQKERVRPMDPIDVKHDFETLENAVRRHVVDALALARGNQRQAAVLLAVSRWKLARLVKRFELRDLVTTMRKEGEPGTPTAVGDGPPETAPCVRND